MTCSVYTDHEFRLTHFSKFWVDSAGIRWQRLDFRCSHCGETEMIFIPIEKIEIPKRQRHNPKCAYLSHIQGVE